LRRVAAAAETLKRAPGQRGSAIAFRDQIAIAPAPAALSGARYLARVAIDPAEAMPRGSR